MKKLIIGLLTLVSISSFAKTLECSIYKLDTTSKSEINFTGLISNESVESSSSIIIIDDEEVTTYNLKDSALELNSRTDLKGKGFYSFNKSDKRSLSVSTGVVIEDSITLLSQGVEISSIAAGKSGEVSLYDYSVGRAIVCK